MTHDVADDPIDTLLDRHFRADERATLAPAVAALRQRLTPDEFPIRMTDAHYQGKPGLLAFTTEGLHFIPLDAGLEPLWLTAEELQQSRRDGFDSEDIEVKTHQGDWYRFEAVGGEAWPSECAMIIGRLARAGPANALQLAADYEAGATTGQRRPVQWQPRPPRRITPAAPSSTTAARRPLTAGVAVVMLIGLVAGLWLFGFSQARIDDVDETVNCLDLAEAGDLGCLGEINDEGNPVTRYDCGTVGGAIYRSFFNVTSTVIEQAVDRRCRSEGLGQTVPLGLSLMALVAAGAAARVWAR